MHVRPLPRIPLALANLDLAIRDDAPLPQIPVQMQLYVIGQRVLVLRPVDLLTALPRLIPQENDGRRLALELLLQTTKGLLNDVEELFAALDKATLCVLDQLEDRFRRCRPPGVVAQQLLRLLQLPSQPVVCRIRAHNAAQRLTCSRCPALLEMSDE